MKTKIEKLKKLKQQLIAGVDSFPVEKRYEVIFDKWSLREVMAHMSGWNLQRIKEINDFLAGKEVEFIEDWDAFNDVIIDAKKDYSWDMIYEEFRKSCEDLIVAYESIPEELVNKKVWSNREHTPSRWIEIDMEHWQEEHIPQVTMFDNLSSQQ